MMRRQSIRFRLTVWYAAVLTAGPSFSDALRESLSERTAAIADRYPLYANLAPYVPA